MSYHITSCRITSLYITLHSPGLDETAVGEKVPVAEGTPEDTDADISTAVVSVDQALEMS